MAIYRKGIGEPILFIPGAGGGLAKNQDCCCENTYVGCYCPTSIPSCISDLTQAQIEALNYFPEVMDDSLNKDCTDFSEPVIAALYRCLGYSSVNLTNDYCFDGVFCPSPGSLMYTGATSENQASLNCNQYINFGTGNLGVCKGYDIPSSSYLGQFCAITEAECSSYANETTSTVWTVGTCFQIDTVSIETIIPDLPPTFQEVCGERNCCDSDDCANPIFCACSKWRIIEVSAGIVYQSSTTLCNIPATYTPPNLGYTGYMQLQFDCNDAGWVMKESWTTINGGPTRTFAIYDSNCVDCANLVGVEIEYGAKL